MIFVMLGSFGLLGLAVALLARATWKQRAPKGDPADIIDDIVDDDDEAGGAAVGGGGGGRGRQSSSKKKKGSAEEKVRLRDDPEARAEMTEMFGQGI